MKNKKLLLILIFALSFCCMKFIKNNKLDFSKIDLETVEKGDIYKLVVASGVIYPVNIINIGAQLTSKVDKLYVDYNDKVVIGQKMALLNSDEYQKDLKSAEANFKKQKVNLELQIANNNRIKKLYKDNYTAKADLEESETNLKIARENVNIAEISVEKAKTLLGYTIIKSPTNGTVLSREVNEGQVITANYTAPILFKVAEDLTKMQIETSIAESDIAMIKLGQKVAFTVDAFKKRIFYGVIKEIRLNATYEQNVVVYTVIISVDNSDGALLPGMTAYVEILVDSVKDVIKLKNTVFRFKPNDKMLSILKIKKTSKEFVEELRNDKDKTVVYFINKSNIKPVIVEKGLSDTTYTEIRNSELKQGDKVISAYLIK